MRGDCVLRLRRAQNLECFDWSAGPNEESEEDTDFWGYQWCASRQ